MKKQLIRLTESELLNLLEKTSRRLSEEDNEKKEKAKEDLRQVTILLEGVEDCLEGRNQSTCKKCLNALNKVLSSLTNVTEKGGEA